MAQQDKTTHAINLLVADHRTVEDLFEKFEKAKGAAAKQKIVQNICTELKVHAQIEEEIFYPALRGKVEEDMLDEATVEHDGAKLLINDLESAAPDEAFYDAKVMVLQEQIEHHVKEEEKQNGSLFTQARRTDVDLEALGQKMAARKAELMAMAKAGGLPAAEFQAVDQHG
ncbi:MAG: hemerythrin domain-containing protein [Alphaproteobacteria bacterium]|nr:hemerythrin domain-containing protein [Alphaproteobacteria bacterium]MBU0796079.1 hemerythrin domain-containing protein [Alphaproteobacteria bacterium]MBU0885770.1 hemerythrin domain-containing protein [Alphaproteobacteria bacterium]MBU1814473.1 hemerythrin domain-containing protein [Alphaproteobacteria bacterium]MBU2091015.1 hemerythrin domain-containing protein [Alphaproteobacteria bacterium]